MEGKLRDSKFLLFLVMFVQPGLFFFVGEKRDYVQCLVDSFYEMNDVPLDQVGSWVFLYVLLYFFFFFGVGQVVTCKLFVFFCIFYKVANDCER